MAKEPLVNHKWLWFGTSKKSDTVEIKARKPTTARIKTVSSLLGDQIGGLIGWYQSVLALVSNESAKEILKIRIGRKTLSKLIILS